MRTIYLDSDFKCHTSNDGTMMAYETDYFDGKCDEFIIGHRFIPRGHEWVREDGEVFAGRMVSVWQDYSELDEAQRKYESELLADAENALAILLGGGA